MNIRRTIALSILVFCLATSSQAQTPIQTEPDNQVKELIRIVDGLFTEFEGPREELFLKKLFQLFPLNETAQLGFMGDVVNLKQRLGTPVGHEFIGFRKVGASKMYYLLYFFTLHQVMPVAWEFTFYRPKAETPWQINFIRLQSDDIWEFLTQTTHQFEAFKNLGKGAIRNPSLVSPAQADPGKIPSKNAK